MLNGHGIRLCTAEETEYVQLAERWFSDPDVLRFSEGRSEPYTHEEIRNMFSALTRKGELYLVDVLQDGQWVCVGDAALLPDAVPITIAAEQRSRGFGKVVLDLLIARARELGWLELRVSGIDPENIRAVRLYTRADAQLIV